MTHSALAGRTEWTADRSSRGGRKIDRFIVHHAATTSLDGILALFRPGGREVSANYALKDRILVATVPEEFRAWTSSSSSWDGRAVTIEVANSAAGGAWPVSAASFDMLARLIADVSARYGFPITDDTVLTHQELYTRYGDSYATACPGDMQRRKRELLALAQRYRSGKVSPQPAPQPTASQVTTWDYSGGVPVPRGPLMARIQRALQARGRYPGFAPCDGVAGPNTIKGIQRTLRIGTDYEGPVDGELGPVGARYIQEYAARYGDYQGPVDGDPREHSWTGFALGLERP